MRTLLLCMLAASGCKTTDSLPGATALDLAIAPDLMPPPDLMPLPGVIMGTFGGIAFQPTSAMSASAMAGTSGTIGIAYLTNKPQACQQLSMSPPVQPKNITGVVIFVGVADGTGKQTAPTATGAYPINNSGGNPTGPISSLKFIQTDATCMTVAATDENAVSGTVNLAGITGDNYSGTFDVMMQHSTTGPMEHVTGEFHATNCPGLGSIFNTNVPCEM